jgi:hypothetical protein
MPGRIFSSSLGRVLMTLLVIGVAGSTVSYGTFASFTAQTSNAGNTFSTGTLTLTNTKTGGTTCLSTGGAGGVDTNSNSTGCSAIFALGGTPGLAPGGTVQTAQMSIQNSGSLPASTLKLWSDACAALDNSSVSVHGTGDPCTKVNISVYNETAGACVVPAVAAACTASTTPTSTVTLATFAASGSPYTVASSLAAGSTATYTFSIQLDSSAGNTMQGRLASTTFHWLASQ